MIYKAGETITFVAFYTANGIAKTGLTDVTAHIYKIGSQDEPITASVTEVGAGLYYCTFIPQEDGAYVCVFSTSDSTVDQKDLASIAFRGIAGVNESDKMLL